MILPQPTIAINLPQPQYTHQTSGAVIPNTNNEQQIPFKQNGQESAGSAIAAPGHTLADLTVGFHSSPQTPSSNSSNSATSASAHDVLYIPHTNTSTHNSNNDFSIDKVNTNIIESNGDEESQNSDSDKFSGLTALVRSPFSDGSDNLYDGPYKIIDQKNQSFTLDINGIHTQVNQRRMRFRFEKPYDQLNLNYYDPKLLKKIVMKSTNDQNPNAPLLRGGLV